MASPTLMLAILVVLPALISARSMNAEHNNEHDEEDLRNTLRGLIEEMTRERDENQRSNNHHGSQTQDNQKDAIDDEDVRELIEKLTREKEDDDRYNDRHYGQNPQDRSVSHDGQKSEMRQREMEGLHERGRQQYEDSKKDKRQLFTITDNDEQLQFILEWNDDSDTELECYELDKDGKKSKSIFHEVVDSTKNSVVKVKPVEKNTLYGCAACKVAKKGSTADFDEDDCDNYKCATNWDHNQKTNENVNYKYCEKIKNQGGK